MRKPALIVEDELVIAMLLEDMLRDLGIEDVTILAQLDPAIKAAEIGDFEFAILDFNLNRDKTIPVAEILQRRQIPFAFFTGYSAVALGAFAKAPLLPKPFSLTDLQQVLMQLNIPAQLP